MNEYALKILEIIETKWKQRNKFKDNCKVLLPKIVFLNNMYYLAYPIVIESEDFKYELKELGKINKPILLKRGLAATIEEWLMSAEYIMAGGNNQVILCERGIRTFEKYTRNTLDLTAIPVIKRLSHLPIIVDPSHATGLRDKVEPMSRAAVAAGCDGLIIEVHHNPDSAVCDGAQSLYPWQYDILYKQIKQIAPIVGKEII